MSQKVLVVADDELNIVQMLEARLKSDDFIVYTAESGEQALESCRQHIPDLVIMDMMMPAPN